MSSNLTASAKYLKSSPSDGAFFRLRIRCPEKSAAIQLSKLGLTLARTKARDCRLLLDGKEPLTERRRARMAHALEQAKRISFDQCAKACIAAHRGRWLSAKHANQWESTLSTYASPVFGALPVAAVDTDLVVKVLSPIWPSKTETATRLRGRIESVLDWATVSKFRQGENPARRRGRSNLRS